MFQRCASINFSTSMLLCTAGGMLMEQEHSTLLHITATIDSNPNVSSINLLIAAVIALPAG
jgi:hypothetical protein